MDPQNMEMNTKHTLTAKLGGDCPEATRQPKRVLVTGGAGFIGTHVVAELTRCGYEPVVVDNLSTGLRTNVPEAVTFKEMDILDHGFQAWVTEVAPCCVIHLAAQIDVQTSITKPRRDAQINILGTLAVLEAAKAAGVEKVVYASSAAVFGEPQYLGVDEHHQVAPLSFYGISKHTPEHYAAAFKELHGVDYTVLRYANVYGPGQGKTGEGGVVSIFAHCFLHGQPPVIFGDGKQTRDFVFVTDIARANIAALSGGSGQVYNIGTGTATSVLDIYQTMAAVTGMQLPVAYKAARVGDILHSYFNVEKARSELGWEAQVPLDEGLRLTLDSMGVPTGR